MPHKTERAPENENAKVKRVSTYPPDLREFAHLSEGKVQTKVEVRCTNFVFCGWSLDGLYTKLETLFSRKLIFLPYVRKQNPMAYRYTQNLIAKQKRVVFRRFWFKKPSSNSKTMFGQTVLPLSQQASRDKK